MAVHVINQKGLKKERKKKFINNHKSVESCHCWSLFIGRRLFDGITSPIQGVFLRKEEKAPFFFFLSVMTDMSFDIHPR